MGRDERKKAGDLFRESMPVFGKKVSFEEAYPQIGDIVIEVEEFGKGVDSYNRRRRYTKQYLPGEFVNCSNPVCFAGGFHLGSHLHKMVSESKTELEDSELCRGNEGSPKGRRMYRKCVNTFKFKITIKYVDGASSKVETDSPPPAT